MRRILQYRLSTLLLLMVAVCLGMGWLAYARDQAQKRQSMIEAHEKATEDLLEEIAYLCGFRRGLAEVLEVRQTEFSRFENSCFADASLDKANMKGYEAGQRLVNPAYGQVEPKGLNEESLSAREREKLEVERLIQGVSGGSERDAGGQAR